MDITPEALKQLVKDANTEAAAEAVRQANVVAPEDRPGGGKSAITPPAIRLRRPRALSMGRAILGATRGWKKAGAELERDFIEGVRTLYPTDGFKDNETAEISWPSTPQAMFDVLQEAQLSEVESDFQKAAVRALGEGSSSLATVTSAGALVPIQYLQDQFVLALTSAVALRNVPGVEVIPVSSNVVALPRESTAATSTVAAEAGTLSSSDPAFTQQSITIRKIYGYKQFSNELLADANPALQNYLATTLARDVALQEDFQFLAGSGSGSNLQGLAGYSGLTTITGLPATNGQNPTYDSIQQIVWGLRRANANPNAWVMHPAVGQALSLLKDSAGRPLFTDVYALGAASPPIASNGTNFTYPGPASGMLLGLPVYFSTQLSISQTQGTSGNCTTIYCGDFRFVKILERAAVDIAVSPHILFTTDQTAMRAIWRGAVAITQPGAVAAPTGFTVV